MFVLALVHCSIAQSLNFLHVLSVITTLSTYSMAVFKSEYVVGRCDAAALARVQQEGDDGDGTWVELLLHCNRSRDPTLVGVAARVLVSRE